MIIALKGGVMMNQSSNHIQAIMMEEEGTLRWRCFKIITTEKTNRKGQFEGNLCPKQLTTHDMLKINQTSILNCYNIITIIMKSHWVSTSWNARVHLGIVCMYISAHNYLPAQNTLYLKYYRFSVKDIGMRPKIQNKPRLLWQYIKSWALL